MGALVIIGMSVAEDRMGEMATAPLAIIVISLAALMVAVPTSLVVGAPLVWGGQRFILRWPLAGTGGLAVAGLILSIPIHRALNSGGVGDGEQELWMSMLFGGVVAGLHGIVLVHRAREAWPMTMLLAAAATAIGAALGVLILDHHRNRLAERGYAICSGYDFASHVLAPERLGAISRPAGHRFAYEQGKWHSLWGRPALYGRYSALFVDGRRTLVAEDKALAPIRPWHRLGVARSVTAQCLTLHPSPDAALLRRAGLIHPFRWSDVAVH